jgi:hypothetical protein
MRAFPLPQRRWLYLAALLGVAEPILAFDVYALFGNATAHTGLPTRWLAAGLAAVVAVAVAGWFLERRGPSPACRALALAVAVVAAVGAANVLLFEHFNVLMGYEVWVHDKGMPDKYAPPGQGFRLPAPPP